MRCDIFPGNVGNENEGESSTRPPAPDSAVRSTGLDERDTDPVKLDEDDDDRDTVPSYRDSEPTETDIVTTELQTIPAPPMPSGDDAVDDLLDVSAPRPPFTTE